MKMLSWNVRGLGNTRTRLEVKRILQTHKPHILFFCETKLMAVQAREVCNQMNFENCFAVNRNGLGRGLALCWSNEVHVNISSFSNHHIDAVVHSENGKLWRCTGIYGHPETQQKQHTWTLLRRLASLFDLLWLCFGDFNEILDPREKNGGQDRNVNMMLSFREAVQVCNLIDVGCKGYPFTWSNRRFGPHLAEERLDRFFVVKIGLIASLTLQLRTC